MDGTGRGLMCLELFNAADGEIELGFFEEGEASFRLDEQYAARQEWILRFLADAIQSHGAFRRPKGNVVLLASLHDSLGRSSVLHTAATASELRSKGIPLLELNGLEHGSGVDTSHSVLVPDTDFISQGGYTRPRRGQQLSLAENVDEASNASPWPTKRNQVVWRGVATGQHQVDEANWMEVPRVKLCLAAKQIEEQLDARISGYPPGVSKAAVRKLMFARIMGYKSTTGKQLVVSVYPLLFS